MTKRNVAASVRARLLNHARESKRDFNLVLTRFCLERLLYRISISKHANHLYLKGALLFDLWFDVPHRPTRDVDFLGFGPSELPSAESTFKEICSIEVDDGVVFLPDTVRLQKFERRQITQAFESRCWPRLMGLVAKFRQILDLVML